MSNGERVITPQGRTFERGRGCWNCKAFENGEIARRHWQVCKQAEEAAIAQRGGDTVLTRLAAMEDPVVKETNARFEWVDRLIQSGHAGMCLVGKAPGTFVHCKYLCRGWTGRDGASVATSGFKLDLLPEELIQVAEENAGPIIGTPVAATDNPDYLPGGKHYKEGGKGEN